MECDPRKHTGAKNTQMRMGRHRIITLLGLTSLVAMMITFTRYSSTYSQPAGRMVIARAKHAEHKPKHIETNEQKETQKTVNNLLENIILAKTILKSKSDTFNSDIPGRLVSYPSSALPSSPSNVPASSAVPPQAIPPAPSQPKDTPNVFVPNDGEYDLTRDPAQGLKAVAMTERPQAGEAKDSDTSAAKAAPAVVDNSSGNKNDIILDVKQKHAKAHIEGTYGEERQQMLDPSINDVNSDGNDNNKAPKGEDIPKPKLVFDERDLKTTESMLIDKPLGCDDNFGANLDLLVIVNSAVTHRSARDAIRETWGKFAVERGAYLLFLIGATIDEGLQRQVVAEDKLNGDILQGRYVDNYYNLTLKTISLMKWLSDRCSQVKYVLKVDDDMFVNMQYITDFSETRTFTKCIIGKLAKKWKPHRNTSNKWFVPMEAFNGTVFPNFATGPAYMLSGDAARPLYEWSVKLKPMYLEDVFITGIVAERAGIRRLNHAMMKNTYIKNIDECVFRKIMTSHKHSPEDIRRLWALVYRQPPKVCDSPKTTKRPSNTAGADGRQQAAQSKAVTPPKSKSPALVASG